MTESEIVNRIMCGPKSWEVSIWVYKDSNDPNSDLYDQRDTLQYQTLLKEYEGLFMTNGLLDPDKIEKQEKLRLMQWLLPEKMPDKILMPEY